MQTISGIKTPGKTHNLNRQEEVEADAPEVSSEGSGRPPASPEPPTISQSRFGKFATGILLYNIPVILFGAFVRATRSGDGCGSHWPLCNGEVIPQPHKIQTLIEFSHRMMSGLDGFLILALLIWAFRAFPAGIVSDSPPSFPCSLP